MAPLHKRMYKHFSEIAPAYRHLRTTDLEPIRIICQKLRGLKPVTAADIGCGDGRYDLLLFEHMNNLHLTCIDSNEAMLRQASSYLKGHGFHNFIALKADANVLPLKEGLIDFIFSFNAVHHFDFPKFVEGATRLTKDGGLVFIYTRLKSQNMRNIWGRYFPLFAEKESRLYESDDITEMVDSINGVSIESTERFQFNRKSTLEGLVDKVKGRHYSTFSLYKKDELDQALKEFQKNIRRQFQDTNRIEWLDENILFVLRAQ